MQVLLGVLNKFNFFLILCDFSGIYYDLFEFITIYLNLLRFIGIYYDLLEFITIYWNLLRFIGILFLFSILGIQFLFLEF